MSGVSFLAFSQWEVASMQPPPPHLKAINPWQGMHNGQQDHGPTEADQKQTLGGLALQVTRCGGRTWPREAPIFDPALVPKVLWPPLPAVEPEAWVRAGPPIKLENITLPMLLAAEWGD